MKADVGRASETLVKYILYLNIVLLVLFFFVDYNKTSILGILIVNVAMLLLRQGIVKDSDSINARMK